MEDDHSSDEETATGTGHVMPGSLPAPETPPETNDHPSHEEQVGGREADGDPAKLADEDRFRKGPGW